MNENKGYGNMTKQEAYELLDAYDADPNGFETCDNLCTVLDALPGQPEGEYTSDQIRSMVDELLDDEESMVILSAPGKGGYRREFESVAAARKAAAELLGVDVNDMVEVESPDGGLTYCYASQEAADADYDGRHAETAIVYGAVEALS